MALIAIINRWNDEFSRYHQYIDHSLHRVVYLTDRHGKAAVRGDLAAALYELDTLDEPQDLVTCCKEIESAFGPIERIIALSELDLLSAAMLRRMFGVRGVQPDRAMLLRNKVATKARLAANGVRVPKYEPLEDFEPGAPDASCTYPLVVKPRIGIGSHGVHKVLCRTEMISLIRSLPAYAYEYEEFVPGSVLHVDGLWNDDRLSFFKASKYLNTCYQFNQGVPLGHVVIDDPILNGRIRELTVRVLRILEFHHGAFHLELILSENNELVFLELNARVGGGILAAAMRDVYNVDLVAASMQIEMSGAGPRIKDNNVICGYLEIPEPQNPVGADFGRTSLIGTIPCLYKEILPKSAEHFVVDGLGGDERLGASFYYRGSTSREVEDSIYATLMHLNTALREKLLKSSTRDKERLA